MSSNALKRYPHKDKRCKAKETLLENHINLFVFLILLSFFFAPDRKRWLRFTSSST